MISRFEAFKFFKQTHEDWGGKNQFYLYHHKIKFKRGETFEDFLVKCLKSKILYDNNFHFLCDVPINREIIPLFCVDTNKQINLNVEIPDKVKEAIKTIKEFAEKNI